MFVLLFPGWLLVTNWVYKVGNLMIKRKKLFNTFENNWEKIVIIVTALLVLHNIV